MRVVSTELAEAKLCVNPRSRRFVASAHRLLGFIALMLSAAEKTDSEKRIGRK